MIISIRLLLTCKNLLASKTKCGKTDIKQVIDPLLAKNGLPESVKVSVKVESGAMAFVADSTFVNRIMYNLVNNAVQAILKAVN